MDNKRVCCFGLLKGKVVLKQAVEFVRPSLWDVHSRRATSYGSLVVDDWMYSAMLNCLIPFRFQMGSIKYLCVSGSQQFSAGV